jgi:hypothetical protein
MRRGYVFQTFFEVRLCSPFIHDLAIYASSLFVGVRNFYEAVAKRIILVFLEF